MTKDETIEPSLAEKLHLDEEELQTILICFENEQPGRVTPFEIKELVRVYRSRLAALDPTGGVTSPDYVMVPRSKLQYVRDLLTEKVYGSHARSPGHNARLEVDEMLSAAPPSPRSDPQSIEVGEMVERLKRDQHAPHFTSIGAAKLMEEAASLLIALDAENKRLVDEAALAGDVIRTARALCKEAQQLGSGPDLALEFSALQDALDRDDSSAAGRPLA